MRNVIKKSCKSNYKWTKHLFSTYVLTDQVSMCVCVCVRVFVCVCVCVYVCVYANEIRIIISMCYCKFTRPILFNLLLFLWTISKYVYMMRISSKLHSCNFAKDEYRIIKSNAPLGDTITMKITLITFFFIWQQLFNVIKGRLSVVKCYIIIDCILPWL